jgi:hypothetical protein
MAILLNNIIGNVSCWTKDTNYIQARNVLLRKNEQKTSVPTKDKILALQPLDIVHDPLLLKLWRISCF